MFPLLKTLVEAEQSKGTYVGARISPETKNKIRDACKEMDVQNRIAGKKMHITLIYSRKHLPDFKAEGKLEKPIIAKPKKLEIFEPQEGDNKVLVILLDAPDLVKRHETIMDEHEATYDFDEYRPHLTLSYDAGDFDLDDHDITDYLSEIEIVEEYDEELNLDWAKSK